VNVPAKVAGFGAGLAVVFGGAALAGGAAGPLHAQPPATARPEMGMGAERMTPQAVRGLAVSAHGLTLRLARATAAPGRRFDLTFRIVDRRGATVRDFDIEHAKRMHFIVVRRDMTDFQHLHPTQAPDGSWSIAMTLRDAGSYRVFADFSHGGRAYTLADDVTVDGTVRSRALPAPARSVAVDGMRVALRARRGELAFDVTRDGRPVAIQDYLGAKGHLVALRQGDLAFLHVHPDANRLRFMAEFPSAGTYRLFLQFKTDDRVHTAAFTQEVSR
jgi:hypothetical protein